jgi:hypothetical protein
LPRPVQDRCIAHADMGDAVLAGNVHEAVEVGAVNGRR